MRRYDGMNTTADRGAAAGRGRGDDVVESGAIARTTATGGGRRTAARGLTTTLLASLMASGTLLGAGQAGAEPGQPLAHGTVTQQVQLAGLGVLQLATVEPPYQDGTPPAPIGGMETGSIPNQEVLPDPRPTGVRFLDALGAPMYGSLYPRMVPLMFFTGAPDDEEGAGGMEPTSAADWMYYVEESRYDRVADIVLTRWDDADAAMAGLRSGDGTVLAYLEQPLAERPWKGHAGDDDYLLVVDPDMHAAGALIRQGDYLIGVSVFGKNTPQARKAAIEIAEKMAANLAVLDPEHGTD